MITPFDIYLFNLMDVFKYILVFISIIIGVLTIVEIINDNYDKRASLYLIMAIGIFLMASIIPSKRTCYEMYLIPKIVNSSLMQNIPSYIEHYTQTVLRNEDNDFDGKD